MLLTNFQFVYMHCARTGDLEAPICLLMILSALTFMAGLFDRRSFLPHFLCLIIIANLKSPILLLPLLADLVFFGLHREARKHFKRWAKAAWILPLGFIWHLGQLIAQGPGGLEAFQTMLTLTSGNSETLPLAARSWGNTYSYLQVTLFGAFPFALAYPFAIANAFRSAPSQHARHRMRVLVVYVAIIYAFFIPLADWHPWYILPAAPLLCALVGIWLDGAVREGRGVFWVIVPALLASGALSAHFLDINPFSFRGVVLPIEMMEWRSFSPLGPGTGTLILWAAFMGGLFVVKRVQPERLRTFAFALIAITFFGVSATRVIEPLQYVDTLSEMDRLRGEIDRKTAAGEALSFPINVSESGAFKVRYFFGEEFEIVSLPRTATMSVYFQLVGYGKTTDRPPEKNLR
jgi:hypothetical protein